MIADSTQRSVIVRFAPAKRVAADRRWVRFSGNTRGFARGVLFMADIAPRVCGAPPGSPRTPIRSAKNAAELFTANIRITDRISRWLDTPDSAGIGHALEQEDLFPVFRRLEECLP